MKKAKKVKISITEFEMLPGDQVRFSVELPALELPAAFARLANSTVDDVKRSLHESLRRRGVRRG